MEHILDKTKSPLVIVDMENLESIETDSDGNWLIYIKDSNSVVKASCNHTLTILDATYVVFKLNLA